MDPGRSTTPWEEAQAKLAARDEEEKAAAEELKVEINALLWKRLPPEITLGAAEELAAEFYDRVMRAWRELRASPTEERTVKP